MSVALLGAGFKGEPGNRPQPAQMVEPLPLKCFELEQSISVAGSPLGTGDGSVTHILFVMSQFERSGDGPGLEEVTNGAQY